MDREYKENMYNSFFDELGELQKAQLAKIAGVKKMSMISPGAVGTGLKAGFKGWKAMGVGGGLSHLGQLYRGAGGGWKGIKTLATNPMAQAGALTATGAGLAAGGTGYMIGRGT